MNYFLLVVLPNIANFILAIGIIGLIFGVLGVPAGLWKIDNALGDEEKKQGRHVITESYKMIGVSVFFLFVTCFIPTKAEVIQLKVISIITEIKDADKIPQKLVDRINELLGEKNNG